jgi:peptidoglycan/xylan/chitin deacetylase (PgdA/CDA1 family)
VSIIWRDDDILMPRHSLGRLLAADDIFQRYGVLHTVAIIAETLTPEIAAAIRERGMSAQLHCWSHDDLTAVPEALAQLPQAVAKIEDIVGVRPTTLFPPWNRVSAKLLDAAKALGLEVSWRKISLEQYIRCEGDVSEDVVNWHYWHQPDVDQLEAALRIASVA